MFARHIAIGLAIALTIFAGLWCGCDSSFEFVQSFPDQIKNTEAYQSEAIYFDPDRERWIYFSWKGSDVDGCGIRINVYDGPGSVPSGFNRKVMKRAIVLGREQWRQVVKTTGIDCKTYTLFESDGTVMHDKFPRIDIRFVDTLDGGRASRTGPLIYDEATRRFSQITMTVARRMTTSGKTVALAENQIYNLLAHEFGHAFGIFHLGPGDTVACSSNPNDVMYSPPHYGILTQGDKATLRALYKSSAYYKPSNIIEAVSELRPDREIDPERDLRLDTSSSR